MSGILFISDLHFCDYRNSVEYEAAQARRLAEFIRRRGFSLVVNLGDAVSRTGALRAGLAPYRRELFGPYLAWREEVGVPFLECGIDRERPFFQDIHGQLMDYVYTGFPGVTIVTFAPAGGDDSRPTGEQLRWLEAALASAAGTTVVVCTHLPYPNSCSRPYASDIYLDLPEEFRRRLEGLPSRVLWAGGHLHWRLEEPMTRGSLTAFMGGRFRFESEPVDYDSYLRILNTETLELETVVNPV